jgi:hypothetical protein
MTYPKQVVKDVYSLAILLVFINACGGGAGDGGDGDGDGGSNPPPVSGNVNGGLTGKIFIHNGWIIDIASGKSRRVPGVVWDDYCYEEDFNNAGNDFFCTLSNPEIDYGLNVSYYGTPNINGYNYILTASECDRDAEMDCLEMRNIETGEVIGERFTRYEHINAGAKYSRDGQYYAYSHNDDHRYSHTSFIINNINHEEITHITMQVNDPMPFDWGPSGEIVLAYNGALYVTPPYSLDGVKIFDLRDHPELTSSDSGEFQASGFSGIRVSPDGSKVAFMLIEGGHSVFSYQPRTPWIINIDGTDFHRFAYAPGSAAEVFGSLAWSQNGEYILITEGYVPTSAGSADGSPGYLYAIPSDSRNVELNQEGENGIVWLETNYKNNEQYLRHTFNADVFWWLP